MSLVLVSWIGFADLQASRGVPDAGLGPIGQAVAARALDEIVLLCNYAPVDGKAYLAWIKPRTSANVSVRQIVLGDPTDFPGIYKAVDPVLQELTSRGVKGKQPVDLLLHLSPGTPAMGAVWIILGKTRYPAELIQSSREKGVRTAAIPFDIAAEFVDLVPLVTKAPDAALGARSGGELPDAPRFGDIVYRCQGMAAVIARARKVAPRTVPVLIDGESGTGKELLARALHEASPRAGKPFVAVNCGAIPRELVESTLFGHRKGAFTGAASDHLGRFREADGGTLFLDELGELPLDAQVKLLRVVQDGMVVPLGEHRPRPVNVRIIAATNRNLAVEVREHRFRDDLFYRLAVAVLHLPPLRERQGDLRVLIDALLEKANAAGEREEPRYQRKKLSPGARNVLLNHTWPGNVRELENTLMRATVWADEPTLSEADVRAALFQGSATAGDAALEHTLGDDFDLDALLAEINRRYVERSLKQANGNKTRAAELLGLGSRQVLDHRIKTLKIRYGGDHVR